MLSFRARVELQSSVGLYRQKSGPGQAGQDEGAGRWMDGRSKWAHRRRWVDSNSGTVLKAGLSQAATSETAVNSLPVDSLAYALGGQLTGW